MTESMIERVVEANRRAWDEWPGPIDLSNLEDVRRAAARAVIEAMRVPTRDMIASGSWATNGVGEVGSTGAANAYTKMIDKALSEPS